ncbi:hypothetical protein NsoK4_02410 [Nitrosopumilus sp. K4]|uniref:hypothetical protein n=1 Tax=Nitrosopumilus sp. K4 TaxID=2795383 RepID=UPI001BAD5C51|nr:hypothetical protein [Nitrosopumilus sp. K4]QUC65137.1 hypothetical protein NsoK4_02410 [Nitrosopumilus sp. K4]
MEEVKQIQNIIDELNQRPIKEYKKMKIEEISRELRDVMEFEQKSFQKIEELEKKGINPDLTKYAKIVCKNTTEREIAEIQEVYLTKIDKEYLNSK